MAAAPPSNTLGLDFESAPAPAGPDSEENSSEPKSADAPAIDASASDAVGAEQTEREKKKPYINPERVKTGGSQRDKLSEEELTERMTRMREQNEKIKQRRLDVKADEDAFKKTQESERIKLAQIRKVQEHVDRTREQNARRKMDKIQSREWDSGKPTPANWKAKKTETAQESIEDASAETTPSSPTPPPPPSDGWTRGGRGVNSPRGRGRGRGRGANVSANNNTKTTAEVNTEKSEPEATPSLPATTTETS